MRRVRERRGECNEEERRARNAFKFVQVDVTAHLRNMSPYQHSIIRVHLKQLHLKLARLCFSPVGNEDIYSAREECQSTS